MNEEEQKQLSNYISRLDVAIGKFKQTNGEENIIDLLDEINAVYGKRIEEVSDNFESMIQQSGLVKRSAKTILAILKNYKISDKDGCAVKEKMTNTFLMQASDVLGDTNNGLSGAKIIEYCNSYARDFNVVIPIDNSDSLNRVPNKRTALFRNLQKFNTKRQFQIIKELLELEFFKNNEEAIKLKKHLYITYGYLAEKKLSNTELIIKTKHWLKNHPESLKQYNSAIMKYEGNIFQRNTLDDIRLSFELLLKELLGNDRSLENQKAELGKKLKDTDASVELRNMVTTVIQYYTNFQNNHVKHNEKVNSNEIEYVIELTSVIMKFLIKISGEQN